jgi:hypothetical protein
MMADHQYQSLPSHLPVYRHQLHHYAPHYHQHHNPLQAIATGFRPASMYDQHSSAGMSIYFYTSQHSLIHVLQSAKIQSLARVY